MKKPDKIALEENKQNTEVRAEARIKRVFHALDENSN